MVQLDFDDVFKDYFGEKPNEIIVISGKVIIQNSDSNRRSAVKPKRSLTASRFFLYKYTKQFKYQPFRLRVGKRPG